MVAEGLRGEDSVAELCRKEGIAQNLSTASTVTLIGNLQAKWPWPQRYTLRLPRGAVSIA